MNRKVFDYSFIACGLLIQVVTFLITLHLTPDTSDIIHHTSYISLLSGCLGVCSVCLASQGRILTFAFGFGQVITYAYLCWTQRFYGELAINAYYFITMIYGVFVWRQNIRHQTSDITHQTTISPHRLTLPVAISMAIITLLVSWLVGRGLAAFTDDTQPYLDAFTTIPALVAQVLMIMVFREHWFIWLAVDILSVILWLRAGDYCMTAQYVFWCANCIYGLHRWRSLGISKV